MSDDLAMSAVFADPERQIVRSAQVTVHPPRTWADLMRRRVRAATGTTQVYDSVAPVRSDARTAAKDLVDLARAHPPIVPKLVVFMVAAVVARSRAARAIAAGDDTTWLRDESSRAGSPADDH
jgi:hypothetical protein